MFRASRKFTLLMLIAAVVSSTVEIFFTVSWHINGAEVFFDCFGGAQLSKSLEILALIYFLLPTLLLCFVTAGFMQEDYSTCCIYVFTRSENPTRWLLRKALRLFAQDLCFYLLLFAAVLVSLPIRGMTVTPTLILQASAILFLSALCAFMILLPINLMALRLGTVKAYLIGIAAYVFFLMVGIYSPIGVSKWLPVSQGLYAWHTPLWFMSGSELKSQITLPGFRLEYSILYIIIVILIEIIVGAYILTKSDLLTAPEGEN